MITFIVALFTFYTFLRIYISVMQIGYVSEHKAKEPILMSADEYVVAGDYAISSQRLKLLGYFVEYALFLWWVLGGFGWLSEILHLDGSIYRSTLFVLLFITINYIATLPFEIYQKFFLDKRFGFSNIDAKLFFLDQLKSALLFLLIGGLLIALLSFILKSFESWWIWGFLLSFVVALAANLLMPTFMALFNKFTPLNNGELKEEIESMMSSAGLRNSGIFVMDAQKRDNRLNAFFGGLGRSKRVVLFDTLLEKLNKDELLAVLGHELGHFKHGDIIKNIALMGSVLFASFYIFGHIGNSTYMQMNTTPDAGVKISFMILLFPLLGFAFTPLISFLSRHNEFAADKYGSSLAGKKNLISALLKLIGENRSFPKSHPLVTFFYHTHPPIVERLEALGYNDEEAEKSMQE